MSEQRINEEPIESERSRTPLQPAALDYQSRADAFRDTAGRTATIASPLVIGAFFGATLSFVFVVFVIAISTPSPKGSIHPVTIVSMLLSIFAFISAAAWKRQRRWLAVGILFGIGATMALTAIVAIVVG